MTFASDIFTKLLFRRYLPNVSLSVHKGQAYVHFVNTNVFSHHNTHGFFSNVSFYSVVLTSPL